MFFFIHGWNFNSINCFSLLGYVFCQLHRLPEQHECEFDHKESGRKEAREKMVTLGPRKVGRSFQRIDDC